MVVTWALVGDIYLMDVPSALQPVALRLRVYCISGKPLLPMLQLLRVHIMENEAHFKILTLDGFMQ